MRPTILPSVLFALTLGAAAAAQPTGVPFGEELVVTEVLLDVLVTDRDGNVILGLGPDDFVVTEGGEPVTLTGATFYSNRERVGDGGFAERPAETTERFFVLFFHDQRMIADQAPQLVRRQIQAMRDSRQWVDSGMLANDWVAVASYDFKLKIQQDFTRDPAAVRRAIEEAGKGRDPGGNWQSRVPPGGGPSLLRHLPEGNALRDETTTIYDALEILARAAGQVPGRKNLLLFSIGFGDVSSFGQYQRDARYYGPMVETLNTNNVAIYAMDLTPLGTDHVMMHALTDLASDTGGRYFPNVLSFEVPIGQVADEASGYYLLSYEARHPAGEGGYQRVEVDVRQKEFRVRAREGYLYGG